MSASSDLELRWRRAVCGVSNFRVILADGEDERFIRAAVRLHAEGVAVPELIGRPERVRRVAADAGMILPDDVHVCDPSGPDTYEWALSALSSLERTKALEEHELHLLTLDPFYVAALRLRQRSSDVVVDGSMRPTSEVIRAALRVVGLEVGSELVSSSFLMIPRSGITLAYADCAIVSAALMGCVRVDRGRRVHSRAASIIEPSSERKGL